MPSGFTSNRRNSMGRGINKKYLEAFKEMFDYEPENENEPESELVPLVRKKKKRRRRRK